MGCCQVRTGCTMRLDVTDGRVPASCLLTLAFLDESQSANPLKTITAGHFVRYSDLTDTAYEVEQFWAHNKRRHVVMIDKRRLLRPQLKADCNCELQAQRRIALVTSRARVAEGRVRGHRKAFWHWRSEGVGRRPEN